MGYSLSLTTNAAQNEGQTGGTAARFTFNLTRDAGDAVETAYSYEIWLLDSNGQPSAIADSDFSGISAITNGAVAGGGTTGDGNFTWTATQTTMTLSIDASLDLTTEPNEQFVIWFFRENGGIHQRFNDGLSFSPTTVITLTNDDTGPPVFTSSANISAAENGTAVGTITATGNGTVTYSLAGVGGAPDQDAGQFSITAGGVLTFNANNDFEIPDDVGANGVYNVVVRATAGGQSTDLNLAVTLTNVNEAPTITFNGGAAFATNVAENSTAVILTATAQSGPGANEPSDTVAWSVTGADASLFTINSSGELRFTGTGRNFESPGDSGANNVYDVTITATDSGNLTDTIAVAVTITDVVESPVISSNGGGDIAFISVNENITTAVTTVVAADQDPVGPPLPTITYSITGGADAADFSIVGATGVLTFVASPNFEAPADADLDNQYIVQVTATSSDPGATTDVQTLFVAVNNVIEAGVPSDVVSPGGGGFTPPVANNSGNDALNGTTSDDSIAGGAGDDTVTGGFGADWIDGDDGNDYIFGGQGADFVRGLNGNDIIYGDEGDDDINGNVGEDQVYGGSGNDTVRGGQGADTVEGGEGDDGHVNGNIGNDLVHGGDGNDTCFGGQNNDTIYGDNGNDRLSGDLGNDILFGGFGADRFAMLNTGGVDWVGDFNAADGDRILLATGQAYTVVNSGNQVFIDLGGGAGIGLAGVSFSSFSADWIVFGA